MILFNDRNILQLESNAQLCVKEYKYDVLIAMILASSFTIFLAASALNYT